MTTRRARWLRGMAVVTGLAGVVALWIWVPRLLRAVDLFTVENVEVVGTRFVEPYAVVRAAGLDRRASVFDDLDTWKAGVMTLPLVESVSVRRRMPGTVVLQIREVEPVALVAGEALRPVDARGWLLDLDPAGTVLDLPLVVGAGVEGGRVAGPLGASAVATITALAHRAPELADRISQVVVGGGELRLSFRNIGLEAVLPGHPTERQLLQLRLAHADLRARGELDDVRSIDVRFRDQVVVSFLDVPVS